MFDPEVSNAAGGDPNIVYYHSHWALAGDEALLIEVTPPACEYWNFQLNNYWMESLDYRYHNIHTNKHLAQYEADGAVRLVVAHADQGLPNWIDTAGHARRARCACAGSGRNRIRSHRPESSSWANSIRCVHRAQRCAAIAAVEGARDA